MLSRKREHRASSSTVAMRNIFLWKRLILYIIGWMSYEKNVNRAEGLQWYKLNYEKVWIKPAICSAINWITKKVWNIGAVISTIMKITAPEGILIVLVEFCGKTPKVVYINTRRWPTCSQGSVETDQTVNWLLSSLKNLMPSWWHSASPRATNSCHSIFFRANREANYLL